MSHTAWLTRIVTHSIGTATTTRLARLRRKGALDPGRAVEPFHTTARPVIAAGSAGVRGPSQGVRVDAGARMRGMWR